MYSRECSRVTGQRFHNPVGEGLPTIHPELLNPLRVDEQDDLPSDPSLVAMSTWQSLGIRVITAVDEAAKRASQEPKYGAGRD